MEAHGAVAGIPRRGEKNRAVLVDGQPSVGYVGVAASASDNIHRSGEDIDPHEAGDVAPMLRRVVDNPELAGDGFASEAVQEGLHRLPEEGKRGTSAALGYVAPW